MDRVGSNGLDRRRAPNATEPGGEPLRRARVLVSATLGYNVLEAGLALGAGIAAGSIALVGFGLDSVIEAVASGVVLWRLGVEARGAERARVEEVEGRVLRVVGVTFLLLAAYVALQSVWMLSVRTPPDESPLGIVLAAVSTVVMPVLAWLKLRAADRLGSAALRAEARETLACAWLSVALLLGLVAHALAGWWWADPVAALVMVPWLLREGREGLRGEACG